MIATICRVIKKLRRKRQPPSLPTGYTASATGYTVTPNFNQPVTTGNSAWVVTGPTGVQGSLAPTGPIGYTGSSGETGPEDFVVEVFNETPLPSDTVDAEPETALERRLAEGIVHFVWEEPLPRVTGSHVEAGRLCIHLEGLAGVWMIQLVLPPDVVYIEDEEPA